ncbi:hypothetical protein [Leisingera sp. F5]|uniref:hypothetical protein n=1 Tax=Leisingera sp. F5 TaxID=1813816 RepID=UPI0025C48F45|nr:hypothetical protein [Leisingera sp. F5]
MNLTEPDYFACAFHSRRFWAEQARLALRSQTTQAPAALAQPDFNPFPFAADRHPVCTAVDVFPGHSAGDLEHPHRESLQGDGAAGAVIRLGFVNTASRTIIAQTVQAYRSETGWLPN